MKILLTKLRKPWARRQRKGFCLQQMSCMSWKWSQAQRFKPNSHRLASTSHRLRKAQHANGWESWGGDMADIRMGCILLAMNARMLWNIRRDLWIDLSSMSVASTLGMTRGMNSRAPQASLCLEQLVTFVSSSSLMTNPHFTKMTNGRFTGPVQARILL
jgi:hypothetical protein